MNYVDNKGQPKEYWDWRFLCQEYTLTNLHIVQNVTRDSIWEIWTAIAGKDTHVFNIAVADEREIM